MLRAITRIFVIAAFFSFFALDSASAAAGPSEGNIVFTGQRVKIQFQPPLRQGDGSTLSRDVARLDFLVNLLDHYLGFLTKMGHVASDTQLILEYAAGTNASYLTGPNRIPLSDLGANSVLNEVNAALRRLPGTADSRLMDDVKAILQVKDHLPRRENTIEAGLGFTCLSDGLQAISPDLDFEALGTDSAITLRPDEIANHLVRLSGNSTGSILLGHSHKPYGAIRVSPNGRWLSFTENGTLKLMRLDTPDSTPISIFQNIQSHLLDLEWAPTGSLVAGIVLNKATLERQLFVFDAETGRHVDQVANQQVIDGNFQFAYPYWAPNGKRLFFVTDHDINLIDLADGMTVPKLVTLPNQLSEIVWSHDSRSFAVVEVAGQTRDKQEFDDRDFRYSILHRYNLNSMGQAVELLEQQHLSSDTIKLVSFWSRDRVLFLEGHLRTPRVSSPLWNLAQTFSARLTPEPGQKGVAGTAEMGAVDLQMEYCYAFKTMESKFRPLYDTGMSQGNHLFMDRFETRWFLGLKLPSGLPVRSSTFCLRHMPYPFPERNETFLTSLSKTDATSLLDFLEAYNLRRFEISDDLSKVMFLSNTRGPLNLWLGAAAGIGEVQPPSISDEEDSETEEPETAISHATSATATSTPPAGAILSIPDLPSE